MNLERMKKPWLDLFVVAVKCTVAVTVLGAMLTEACR